MAGTLAACEWLWLNGNSPMAQQFSGYFVKKTNGNYQAITLGQLASYACQEYQNPNAGGKFCNNTMYDEGEHEIPKPQWCGGTGPNTHVYNQEQIAANNAKPGLNAVNDAFEAEKQASEDKIKKAWGLVLALIMVAIIIGLIWKL